MKVNDFYYNTLSKEGKKVYHAIKEGLMDLKRSFMVPKLSNKELSDIYFMIRLDNPKIFYSVKFSYRYYPDSEYVEMIPEYLFEKAKVVEHIKAMDSRIKKLARETNQMTEIQKEEYVHDFICKNVKYDKLKKAYSHEIIGALGQGVAVCEGMAKAVKALCDEMGVWCITVISSENEEKGIKYRHAWNIIKIGKNFYHLDVTFDNTLGKQKTVRYDYFNLSDEQIFKDHEPLIYPAVKCEDGTAFYYKEKKKSFTKYEDVQKRALQSAKKGKELTFNWRGGYLTKDVISSIYKIAKEEGEKKGKNPVMSVNCTQAVIHIVFEENITKTDIIMEEVNEGETIVKKDLNS